MTQKYAKNRSRGPVGPLAPFSVFFGYFWGPRGPGVVGNASGDLLDRFSMHYHVKWMDKPPKGILFYDFVDFLAPWALAQAPWALARGP